MGPPPFRRWRFGVRPGRFSIEDTLQWGHRLSAMEISGATNRPSLSMIPLQWGHRLSAMEMCRRATSRRSSLPRFNGATAFRRWRCIGPFPEIDFIADGLQWGHRPFGDGDTPAHPKMQRKGGASMGPPPFGDGDDGLAATYLHNNPASMGPPPFGDGDRRTGNLADSIDSASMGPPPFGDGDRDRKPVDRTADQASMGPPPFGDGDGPLGRCIPLGLTASMGPPPFGDGDSYLRGLFRRILMLKCGFPQETINNPDGRPKLAGLCSPCSIWEAASGPAWPLHHPTSRGAVCACASSYYHRRPAGQIPCLSQGGKARAAPALRGTQVDNQGPVLL